MFVNLFKRDYIIEITSKPLMRDGKALDAMLQDETGRIFISSALPPNKRREKLHHECRHVYLKRMGLPADEESDCRDSSEFFEDLMVQLEAQCGNTKLMSLQPPTQAYGPNEYRGFAPNSRHECIKCGAIMMSGSVTQNEPKLHPDYDLFYVDREFECEACGTMNKWSEFCSERGAPTGQPVPGKPYKAA
jgi:hypothetical protein